MGSIAPLVALEKGCGMSFGDTHFGSSVLLRRMLAPLLVGLFASALLGAKAQAAEASQKNVYLISDRDGYGLGDCVTQHQSCGKIVADSFCESRGHSRSASFGPAEDLTASVSQARAKPSETAGAAMIICED